MRPRGCAKESRRRNGEKEDCNHEKEESPTRIPRKSAVQRTIKFLAVSVVTCMPYLGCDRIKNTATKGRAREETKQQDRRVLVEPIHTGRREDTEKDTRAGDFWRSAFVLLVKESTKLSGLEEEGKASPSSKRHAACQGRKKTKPTKTASSDRKSRGTLRANERRRRSQRNLRPSRRQKEHKSIVLT